MPTFRNLYYASSVVVPNPDLEAEHGWNYEIGYKYSENGRRLNLTAFRIDIKDQIVAVKNLVIISLIKLMLPNIAIPVLNCGMNRM